MDTTLLPLLAKNWWLILLRGLVAIVFGILAIAWPGVTLITLVMLYGIYVAFDGIFALAAGIRGGTSAPRWWLLLAGIVSLAAAAASFFYPGLTAIVLLTFVGIWAIIRGLIEIAGAIRIRHEIDNEWWLILSGVMSVIFGLFVILRPGAGALALIWVIGIYAIVLGILLTAFALRLRSHFSPA